MGYLSQVKAKGKQYIYLSEYRGKEQYSMKNEINVFAFGNRANAIAKMHYWLNHFNEFPLKLIEKDTDERI